MNTQQDNDPGGTDEAAATGEKTTGTLDLAVEAAEGPASARGAALVLLHSARGTEAFELRPGEAVVVGRKFPSEVTLPDRTLSARHARVSFQPPFVLVEDLDSRNGVWFQEERVPTVTLAQTDTARLGSVRLSVHLPTTGSSGGNWCSFAQLQQSLRREVDRAKEFRRPLGLVLLTPCNRVEPAEWCGLLATSLGAAATVSPYGGEWFALLLPEAGRLEVLQLARNLEQRLGSVRLGVALLPLSGLTGEALLTAARRALRQSSAAHPVSFAHELEGDHVVDATEPHSAVMAKLYSVADRAARGRLPILLLGETGTGKEVMARRIHAASPRANGPLHAVNCGGLPATLVESTFFGHEKGAFTGALQSKPGVFEQADGGTLFLDEIGELPPAAQAAILRVLETRQVRRLGASTERPVDVRIVAATHQDLNGQVEAGGFRLDLLHRLNAITLRIPPLRERQEEIAPLVQLFLQSEEIPEDAPRLFSPSALRRLESYDWPGNVRELRNVVERAATVAFGTQIELEDLPETFRDPQDAERQRQATELPPPRDEDRDVQAMPLSLGTPGTPPGAEGEPSMRDRLAAYERGLIEQALNETGGHKAKAAKLLNMPLRTFMKRLKEYEIVSGDGD